MKTLVIVNPRAGGGRTKSVFARLEGQIKSLFGDPLIAFTENSDDVSKSLDAAAKAGVSRIIAVGGDGTNHVVLNALAQRGELGLTYGSIPVGTGSDWSRCLGVPADPVKALEWLAAAEPVPCDMGSVEYLDTSAGGKPRSRVFLNISSAGVSGEVVQKVNRARRRTPFTFIRATLATLMRYKPQRITIICEDQVFYSGKSYLLVVANGRYFGRGMWITPLALVNDGLFDVVVVEGMPRRRILLAFQTVFKGTHLKREDVHFIRSPFVHVRSEEGPLGLDFDGEEGSGQDLRFAILPGAANLLIHPSCPALKSS
jgi:YegS/Rv2252/BmrU family lipid kinase